MYRKRVNGAIPIDSSRPHPRAGAIAFIAFLAAIAFWPALQNGFVFDDHWLVERNPVVRSLDPRVHLGAPFWSRWEKVDQYWRPLVTASVAADRALWGERSGPLHLTNLLLHVSVAIALLVLLGRIGGARGAVAGAALFAVHPLQTEAVAWIMGRTDLLAGLFCVSAAALYAGGATGERPSPGRTCGVVSLFVAALLCKEAAIALPAMLIAVDLATLRWAAMGFAATRRDLTRRIVRHLVIFVPVVSIWLVARWMVIGQVLGDADLPDAIWNNPIRGEPLLVRWWTAVHVAGRYLWLAVWPVNLSADYRPEVVGVVASPFSTEFTIPFVALVATACLAIALARRSPLALFGVLAGVGAYLPVSHLLFAAPVIMAERFLYLPFVGVAAVAGAAFDQCTRRWPPWFSRGVGLAALAVLAIMSQSRSRDWRDDRTLFAATVAAQPRSVLGWNNLGAELSRQGDLDGALDAFERALALRRDDLSARLNHAVILHRLGESERAVAELRAAAAGHPRSGMVRLHLAEVELAAAEQLEARGRLDEARQLREGVVEQASAEADRAAQEAGPGIQAAFLVQVAQAWVALGRVAAAEPVLDRALAEVAREEASGGAVPETVAGIRCRVQAVAAQVFAKAGRSAEAAARWTDAADSADGAGQPELAASFRFESARNHLASGKPELAEPEARRAFEGIPARDPRSADARMLLVRLLARRGAIETARALVVDDPTRLAAAEGALEGGRPAEALALYDEMFSGGSAGPRVLTGRGRAHLALGDASAAETELERALGAAPSGRARAAIWCDLARVSQSRGDVQTAIERFGEAAAADPDFAEAWYRRGKAQLDRGQVAEAESDLARALSAGLPRTEVAEVGLLLADLAARRGDPREARRRVEELLAADPDNASALDWIQRRSD